MSSVESQVRRKAGVVPLSEEEFLRAIQDNPDDDVNRWIDADWLQERGDNRGEYLRVYHQVSQVLPRLAELRQQVYGEEEEQERRARAWLSLVGKGRRFGDRRRFAVTVGESYKLYERLHG